MGVLPIVPADDAVFLLVSVIALVGVLVVALAALPVRGPELPALARRIAEFIGGWPTRPLLDALEGSCWAAAGGGKVSASATAGTNAKRAMIAAPQKRGLWSNRMYAW